MLVNLVGLEKFDPSSLDGSSYWKNLSQESSSMGILDEDALSWY